MVDRYRQQMEDEGRLGTYEEGDEEEDDDGEGMDEDDMNKGMDVRLGTH